MKKDKRIEIRLTESELQHVEELARSQKKSKSDMIRDMLKKRYMEYFEVSPEEMW